MTVNRIGEEGTRDFVGVVADIKDPYQLGRIKVRIFGTHDDTVNISDEDLPWAQVIVSPTSASLSGVGISPTGIAPDSYVYGKYLDGMEGQFPLILGTFHKMPKKDPNLSDVNILARGTNKLNKKLTGPEPKSAYNAQYPKNQVFESKSGHIIEIDDTDGSERIHIYHRKGTYIEINKDGRVVIKSVDSSIDVTDKDKTIYAKGDITIESEKNIELKAKDNIILDAKNISISGGSSSVKLSSGILGMDSGNVKVKGDYVKVDSPLSSVSGAAIQSGKVSAKNIVVKKVAAQGISAPITGALTSIFTKFAKSLSGLPSLGSTLDTLFSNMSTSIAENELNITPGSTINIDKVVNKIDETLSNIDSSISAIDTSIDTAFTDLSNQINKKISNTISIDSSTAVDEITTDNKEVWV